MIIKRKKLIRALDKVFSEYIRRRDAGPTGIGRCITCGRVGHWKTMDCGHYIKRQHMTTRYDEKNCNMQCKYCNAFEQGANEIYKRKIDEKWGAGVSDWLEVKRCGQSMLRRFELEILIDHYKQRIKELTQGETKLNNCKKKA